MEGLKIGSDDRQFSRLTEEIFNSDEIEKLWTKTIQEGETFPEPLQKDIEKEIEKAIRQYHETITKTGE